MKFESQLCTTKIQSERLLALGLKKETADLHYEGRANKYEEWEVAVIGGCYYSWDYPAWSLHRLLVLSKMSNMKLSVDNIYDKIINYIEYLIKFGNFNKEYLED